MSIRNTSNFISSQMRYYAQVRSSNLSFLQFQASTGLKHSRSSDDPLAAQRLFSLKRTTNKLDSDKAVMDEIEHTLNLSVSNLTEAHQITRAAQRIGLDARQADQGERAILANEVDDLLGRLVSLGNSTDGGRYQYSGQADKAIPFVKNPNGDLPPYIYQGSQSSLAVDISENVRIESLKNGSEIFGSKSRSASVYIGNTGAKPGSGTDNGNDQGTLQVAHTATNYIGASGVTAGTDSAALDTIIGPLGEHQLTIVDQSGTGTSGTIQLNGGLEFPWDSSNDNLRIEGPNGEVAYVNTQSISAGFSGDVDLTADGTISTDGGNTTTPIDFSNNQIVASSNDQAVTNVDTSEITRSGSESIEYGGSSDLFSTLVQLRDDLRNTRGLQGDDWDDAIIRRDVDIERHANQLLEVVGQQSVSLESIVALRDRNRSYNLEVSQIIDDVENADLTDVVLQLQQEQNLLEYTYATSSTILNQNILDYLR